MKIFLGKQQCHITEYENNFVNQTINFILISRITSNIIECINQACKNDYEQLELNIQVNNQSWQIEKTFFQCRKNPVIFDWYPRKSIIRYID